MMNFIWKLAVLPFSLAWYTLSTSFKIILTVFLIFLGPFGWGIIAGWWGTGKVLESEANKADTQQAILAELRKLNADKA